MNLPTDVMTKLCALSCRREVARGTEKAEKSSQKMKGVVVIEISMFKGKSHCFVDDWLAWLDLWRVRELSLLLGRQRHRHKCGPAKPECVELSPGERGWAHVLLFHKSLGAAKSSAAPPAPA